MKAKQKLNLEELRIENFVTELNQSDVKSINGGAEPPLGAIGSLPLIIGSKVWVHAAVGVCNGTTWQWVPVKQPTFINELPFWVEWD